MANDTERCDWRSVKLAEARKAICAADPEIVEERKWRKPSNPAGVPTWSCDGIVCTGETYKDKIKLTFARGAALDDPAGLFNTGFAGNTRRAIDLFEGDSIDGPALTALVKEAVALNRGKSGG